MIPDFLTEAREISPEVQALRERIHRRPELGRRERETAALVETYLRELGIETQRVGETGVVGTLRGSAPGRCAALRADMDALPVCEATGAAFASEHPGVMHACGHDVHTAAALGAAKLLSRRGDVLRGTVKFLFEPDEEGDGGAAGMVAAGCLEGVEAVFGCHVSPALPLGTFGIRDGKFYAAADVFDAVVLGKSAHGAEREKGVDALAAAAEMVTALLELPRLVAPERAVITVGILRAGTARNVLPDRAEFQGILRSLGPDSRARLRRAIRDTLETVAAVHKTELDLSLRAGYGGVVNTPAETALVRRALTALPGTAVTELSDPTLTTEDFGAFIDAAGGGCFYHVGVGGSAPLHAPDFLPPPEAPVLAAAAHAAVLWSFLEQK